jgi:ATP-dependent DNA helicase RecQ
MGIDIPDIRGVVHYLLTESAEQYYQQIGRVGRDGKPAWAVLFYSDKNIDVRKTWYIERSFPTEDDVRRAFTNLTDERKGKRTVNYFAEGDQTQSAYHYLARSSVISPVCKGIRSLDVFEPASGVTLPKFEAYRDATFTGLLIPTAIKVDESECEILSDIYRWLAEGKLEAIRSPGKCLVIDISTETLPDLLLEEILEDVAEKKAYRLSLFDEFVGLLEEYTNTFEFHQRIGQYLGIDKYRCGRIYRTLSGDMVRSKSVVIIANILYQTGIPFEYETFLTAPDGSCRLPDFTIEWRGQTYYWEHLGMLDVDDYWRKWELKKDWYAEHFPGQVITTTETSTLSEEAKEIITSTFGVEPVYEEIE